MKRFVAAFTTASALFGMAAIVVAQAVLPYFPYN
jgi:hypothetical protein